MSVGHLPEVVVAKRMTKAVGKLRPKDLSVSPLWEFIAEPEGPETEEWVQPRPDITQLDAGVLARSFIMIVACEFTFADGTVRPGYCTVASNKRSSSDEPYGQWAELTNMQPTVLMPKGQVAFWFGSSKPDHWLERQYRRLEKEPEQVFPVRFRATVPVAPDILGQGEIPGFLYSQTGYVFST